VLGEEFGLIGILVLLLLLYAFIMVRGIYIATQAQDTFTRLLAGSLSLTFVVYIIVNTGMVTGLLPVVGLPLPLVSYGGTSMVTLMIGFGMLMSIHTHRKLLAFVRKGGWQRGQPVAFPAQGVGPAHQALIEAGTRPSLRFDDVTGAGISVDAALPRDTRVSLIELDTHTGAEHWVALNNFQAIMRYNPRSKYAMAVYQLSEAIREQHKAALAQAGEG
jgi:hypothetical protein